MNNKGITFQLGDCIIASVLYEEMKVPERKKQLKIKLLPSSSVSQEKKVLPLLYIACQRIIMLLEKSLLIQSSSNSAFMI